MVQAQLGQEAVDICPQHLFENPHGVTFGNTTCRRDLTCINRLGKVFSNKTDH